MKKVIDFLKDCARRTVRSHNFCVSINSLYAVQNLRQQVDTDKGDKSVKDLVMLGCCFYFFQTKC